MTNQKTNGLADDSRIGHYLIVSKIGAGGMGEVYLAHDTKLDRKVALKILPSEFAEDADRMRRFVREAKSVSALNHPNIITIYEIAEADGTHFIATEFIDGQTLNEYAKSNPSNYKSALEVAIQIVSALDEAHQAGIIHRDIKPDNVMIRGNGLVKILDFGIAKLSTPTSTDGEAATAIKGGTSAGMIIGTASYMSPEQARGKEIGARSDIFSFGIVFYEMLTGKLPFAGETALESISSILKDEPPPLHQTLLDIPNEIERIAGKVLRKDREERYQTAKDLLLDLKEAKHDLEFQNKLERSIIPNQDANKTQILKATTLDGINQMTSNQTLVSNPKSKYLAAGLLTLILAVGGFFGYKYFAPTNKQIESIAVMPFVNESGNSDVEYLSDGMTETLIKSLSQLPNLAVKSRSTVFYYKDKEISPKKIGEELNVQAVLLGRVVQRGDDLKLSLELVNTNTQNVIWAEEYDRKQSDLVTLQSEIARDVSTKLKSKLSGPDAAKIEKKYTENPEAYQLYLKGRYQWNKRTSESLKQGVEFFNQAIEKDPNYALAYSGLAESYTLFGNYSVAPPLEAMPKAKAAALRAIELDDSFAESHVALGIYYSDFAWNQLAAEKEFRRAIELNPNYAPAHQQFATGCLSYMGRFDEAIAEGKRAIELDPLSPIIGADLGQILLRARRFDESIAQLNKVIALDQNFWVAYWYLGQAYHGNGQYREAVAAYRKGMALNDNSFLKALLIRSLTKTGERGEAVKLLDELQAESARRYVSSSALAIAYGALAEKDKAFAFLEKDVAERASRPPLFSISPNYDDLRDDPRFNDLVRRVELAKMD